MNVSKKAALVLALLTGFAVFAYGETSYSLSSGYYRFSEQFFNDDFGRGQNGATINFTFYYFPETIVVGFLFRTSFGILGSGYEFQGNETQAMESRMATDVRLAFAPSYRLKLGSRVSLPLSAGLVFSLFWEQGSLSTGSGNSYEYREYYYEAVNLGIMADASLIIFPSKTYEWLFLKQGVSLGWDFLRSERGEMMSAYRNISNALYKVTPYSAIAFSVFFGVGIQLD